MKWVEMSVKAAGVKERFEDGGESCCEGWLETVEPEVAVFTFMTRCSAAVGGTSGDACADKDSGGNTWSLV